MAFKKMAKRIAESPEFKRGMMRSGAEKETGPTAGDAAAARMIAEKMSGSASSGTPRKRGLKGIGQRVAGALKASQEAKKNPDLAKTLPQLPKFKKGGMADKSGRAMTRKTADTKGRAMKKGK
jgi:hypothetical protein